MAQNGIQMADLMGMDGLERKGSQKLIVLGFKVDVASFVYAVIISSGRKLEVRFGYFCGGALGIVYFDNGDRGRLFMNDGNVTGKIELIRAVDFFLQFHAAPAEFNGSLPCFHWFSAIRVIDHTGKNSGIIIYYGVDFLKAKCDNDTHRGGI